MSVSIRETGRIQTVTMPPQWRRSLETAPHPQAKLAQFYKLRHTPLKRRQHGYVIQCGFHAIRPSNRIWPNRPPLAVIQQVVSERVPELEQPSVQTLIIEELRRLHEGVLARYGLRPSEYTTWKAMHGH